MEEKYLEMYGIKSFLHDKTGYDLEVLVFEPTANIADSFQDIQKRV